MNLSISNLDFHLMMGYLKMSTKNTLLDTNIGMIRLRELSKIPCCNNCVRVIFFSHFKTVTCIPGCTWWLEGGSSASRSYSRGWSPGSGDGSEPGSGRGEALRFGNLYCTVCTLLYCTVVVNQVLREWGVHIWS